MSNDYDERFPFLSESMKAMLRLEDERKELYRSMMDYSDQAWDILRLKNSKQEMLDSIRAASSFNDPDFIRDHLARYEMLSMPPARVAGEDLDLIRETFRKELQIEPYEQTYWDFQDTLNRLVTYEKPHDILTQHDFSPESFTSNMSEMIASSTAITNELLDQQENFKSPWLLTILDQAQELQRYSDRFQFEEGIIWYQGEVIAQEDEVRASLHDVIEDAKRFSKNPANIVYYAFKKIRNIDASAFFKDILRGLIISIVIIYIKSALTSIPDLWSGKDNTSIYNKEYKKYGEARLHHLLHGMYGNNARIVGVDTLNVRLKPNIKSRSINKLYGGAVIWLQEKRKKWSRVMWISEGTNHMGWVYNKHIVKPKMKVSKD